MGFQELAIDRSGEPGRAADENLIIRAADWPMHSWY